MIKMLTSVADPRGGGRPSAHLVTNLGFSGGRQPSVGGGGAEIQFHQEKFGPAWPLGVSRSAAVVVTMVIK